MRVVPLHSRVVVEAIVDDSKIVMPHPQDATQMVEFFRMQVVEVGDARILENGERVPIPLSVGDEVVVDGRFCHRLEPERWYDDRKLMVIDVAGVLCKVERDKAEKVKGHKPSTIATPNKGLILPN